MAESAGAVRTEVRGSVLVVTLDRPPANAIDVATSQQLYAAFARLRDEANLRVGVITGTGRFFSAGWDLKAAAAGEAPDADHGPGGFAGLTELELDKPVIAAVNGIAVGGGFELALACDLMVVATQARLGLTEAALGLIADSGGVIRLPRRLPYAIAMELLLTGRLIDGGEAVRWGLANAVVSQSEVLDEALKLADRIVAMAPLSVVAVSLELRGLHDDVTADFTALRSGRFAAYDRLVESEDAREGSAAFAQGRPPRWLGR